MRLESCVMKKILCVMFLGGACASLAAQTSDWDRVRHVPAGTKVHVAADKQSETCRIDVVDEATLRCSNGHSQYSFARAEVKSVKLTRYAVSTLVGAGIGAGVGAGIGLGVTQDKNGWFNGDIRGVFAALGGVVGGAAMGPTDVFRGPTIYRRGAKN